MSDFKIGDTVYYPLMREILKTKITEIHHKATGVTYVFGNRNASMSMVFKTFEAARQYCLDDEKIKYEKVCKEIMGWKE